MANAEQRDSGTEKYSQSCGRSQAKAQRLLKLGRLRRGSHSLLKELILRFVVGGAAVCVFAMIGDLFKPKSFAGLFGAAPSIALVTVGLTLLKEGPGYAATEHCSVCLCNP